MSAGLSIRSYHTIIDAPPEVVFDFVSDLRNFSRWAIHFCKEIRLVDDGAVVTTASGELWFGTTGDRDSGVLDWWCGPTMQTAERWPTRVVALPDGRSVYQVTAIFGADLPPQVDRALLLEIAANE